MQKKLNKKGLGKSRKGGSLKEGNFTETKNPNQINDWGYYRI